MIYLLVVILNIFCIYRFDIHKNSKSDAYFVLLLIAFISISGFRYYLGGDSIRYISYFEDFPTFNNFTYSDIKSSSFDPLWIILNVIIKTICDDFIFFQFIHAIILNSAIFYFLKKYSNHIFTDLFFYLIFYYLYFNMEILRESLAIVGFLFSLKYLYLKKWFKYFICTSISILFHSSAVILLTLPVLAFLKPNIKTLIFVSISVTLVFYVFTDAISMFFISDIITNKYALYKNEGMNINGILLRIITYIIFPIVIIYINTIKLKTNNKITNSLIVSYFFIASISIGNTAIGGRFINYFTPVMCLYLTDFFYNVKYSYYFKHCKHVAIYSILIAVMTYKMSYFFKDTSYAINGTKNYVMWFPYTNILCKNKIEQKRTVAFREKFVNILMKSQSE